MIFLDSMSNLALPVAVCGLTGIILTTTELKRAQTKLTKERALLRCLMDAVSDLIFIKDRDGRRLLMDTLKAPYNGSDGEALGLVGIGTSPDSNAIMRSIRCAAARLIRKDGR